VEVRYGEVPVDATAVFERVEALTDRDVEQPTVYVGEVVAPEREGQVERILGTSDQQFPQNRSTGRTSPDGRVKFDPGGDRASVERTLAHEYVHVVQFQSGMVPQPDAYLEEVTTDSRLAWQMVLEGGAVYATDAYGREHMPDARLQSTVFAEAYADPATPETRLTLAWYHLGYRYVDAQVDGPADLASAYDPMPTTTEQVLHDRAPATEPPLSVDVDPAAGDDWTQVGEADRRGELYVRVLLRTQLDRERAVAAASGWGGDRAVTFTDGDDDDGDGLTDADGMAWVLRWDTTADADEFEDAVRAYADRRASETSGEFRVRRLATDTVVVLVGTPTFLSNASVQRDGDGVEVTVGDRG
jgi:hypothetical protein